MSRHILRGLAALLLPALVPAVGQAQPKVLDVNQRSGLITRMAPITPRLPDDPDRDRYYNTYWQDFPKRPWRNSPFTGGLYGMPLNDHCAKCNQNFYGSPGPDATENVCRTYPRWTRGITNMIFPYHPVGYYYAGGCSVPIYDLDPLVPGPGPFPLPYFKKRHNGG